MFVTQCNRQSLRQVDNSADGARRMHSTWRRRPEVEPQQPLHRPPPEHTLRSNLHWRFLASVRLKRPLLANVSQSLAEEVSCLPQPLRCECFAYRRNNDETPSVKPVRCASTPPLFDSCMRNLVLACGVMTILRQAGLGLADLLVKTSTTSPCCNS